MQNLLDMFQFDVFGVSKEYVRHVCSRPFRAEAGNRLLNLTDLLDGRGVVPLIGVYVWSTDFLALF